MPPPSLPLPAYTFGVIYAGLNEDWMSIISYIATYIDKMWNEIDFAV